MPGVFNEVQSFIQAHEECGEPEKLTGPVTAGGYTLHVICPCGDRLDRRVTPADARHDFVHTSILTSRN